MSGQVNFERFERVNLKELQTIDKIYKNNNFDIYEYKNRRLESGYCVVTLDEYKTNYYKLSPTQADLLIRQHGLFGIDSQY